MKRIRDEIVCPEKARNDPTLGPVAVMAAMGDDVALIRQCMGVKGKPASRILTSRLYQEMCGDQDIALVGPMIGAPYAVMVLEKLIILGAQRIVFFGWCGSIRQDIPVGDFLVPDRAVSEEGTSAHYPVSDPYPRPSGAVLKAIEESLTEASISFRRGAAWSTDAPYRETKEKVVFFQKQGVLGVDMELSALFTVASFRGVDIGALLVVSDELGSLRWKPGYSSSKLKRSRKVAAEAIPAICRKMASPGEKR